MNKFITNRSHLLRHLLLMVTILAAGCALTSCDDDDDDNWYYSQANLTGVWDGTWPDGSVYRYVFYANGSGYGQSIYPAEPADIIDDYVIRDGYLYILWAGAANYELKGPILIGQGYFSVQFNSGGPWIDFYLR